MKGLLNEVTRLQKLAGILTEAKMDIPRTDRSKSDMIDYEDLGDGKVNIQMPNGEEVIVDKNAMTATWNGQDITKNLHTQGGQVFLKFGNDVEITDILKNLKQDKKKEDSLEEDNQDYNDYWSNKKVKVINGKYVGKEFVTVGGKNEIIDVNISGRVVGIPRKDLKVYGSTDGSDWGPRFEPTPYEKTDYQTKRDNDKRGYFGINEDELDEAGAKKRGKKKKNPGLWANIRAQRAKGEKPAHPNSKEYKDAVKSAKEINKGK